MIRTILNAVSFNKNIIEELYILGFKLLIVCGSETKKDNNMKPKVEIFAEM